MTLLVDMNLSPAWVPYLAEAGHEAVHWSTVGRHDAPDSALVDWAVQNGAVVLTNGLDVSAILAASRERAPSVVQVRMLGLRPDAAGPVVVAALRPFRDELADGALVTLDPSRARARLLPLQ